MPLDRLPVRSPENRAISSPEHSFVAPPHTTAHPAHRRRDAAYQSLIISVSDSGRSDVESRITSERYLPVIMLMGSIKSPKYAACSVAELQ